MWADVLTILTLFVLEAMLSIDNAAVLAVMVKDLPGNQGKKALRYGLIGAYVLRGLCLLAAGLLAHVWWLKLVGGGYLLYLTWNYFRGPGAEDDIKILEPKSLWKVIVAVELADLTFSMDNVFAAVAMSPKMWVVITGVFMGIAAMRFVAGGFMTVMKKYPFLDNSAFVVIGLLGIKLILSGTAQGLKWQRVNALMEKHSSDFAFSAALLLVFFVPLLFSLWKKGK